MKNIEQKLKDIGFTPKETKQYLKHENDNNFKGQCECLNQKRQKHLENIHKEEKQITNLDYLKYTLEKERNEK